MPKLKSTLPIVLSLSALCVPLVAHADTLIFNLSPTNGYTIRSAGSGPGQGVIAGTTTTITSFSLYVATPSAEDLKFFVDNAAGSVVFSTVEAVGSNSSLSWISSGPLSFTLNAGSEYFFGVVGDGSATDIGYIFPTVVYSSNGLTADASGNINVSSYSNPTGLAGNGTTEIGLQLYGAGSSITTTPEPSSLVLLGSGALALLGAARRRFPR